ncbi:MAG: tRNA (guanosine(46)-N7)-methyltransferase TrmB [Verrucomicrobia bacterium]|nr:tRNA (guanosine(46)-N7)-methyltransferase TrmB [Verrucomicrobiota bacterium]
MKPKDLKSPLTWEERRPIIADRVLYVPTYYHKHHEWQFPGWEASDVFGRKAPIHIEYCAGNGAWIVENALKHPDKNWVAVEIQFDRARKIWSKIHNLSIKNLLVVCGDAKTFTEYYVPKGSVDAIYINFPDPWPKEKHAKKRIIQPPFVREMAAVAAPHATAMVVSDDLPFITTAIDTMQAASEWKSRFSSPAYVTSWEGYGASYFSDLWSAQGKSIYYTAFEVQK